MVQLGLLMNYILGQNLDSIKSLSLNAAQDF